MSVPTEQVERERPDTVKWKDTAWVAWGLAKAPAGSGWYLNKNPHPDTKEWTL